MTSPADTATTPTLAACLIVKDEQRHLAACLDTLAGLVDEIVVVDTGSTDSTVAIAESFGARVVHAPWTGDFAAARNVGLDAVTADWVLSVDADERIVADAEAIKPMLALAAVPLLALEIVHHLPESRAYRIWSGKLFRRYLRWTGAVHERPVLASGDDPDQQRVPQSALRVEHFGYIDRAQNQAKAARNAEIAEAELVRVRAGGGSLEEETRIVLQIARSLEGSGEVHRAQDAIATLERLDTSAVSASLALQVDDYLAKTYLGAGDPGRVVELTRRLRAAGANPAYCDWLDAQCLLGTGHLAEAHGLLAGLTDVVDLVGGQIDPEALAADKQRAAEAAAAAPVTGEIHAVLDSLVAATGQRPAASAEPRHTDDGNLLLLHLARSLAGSGRQQEAFDTLAELRALAPATSDVALQGSDLMAQLLMEAQEYELALSLSEEMRLNGADADYCDWLAGQAWAHLGDFAEAWFLLEPLTEVVDPGGRLLDADVVAEMRQTASVLAGVAGVAG